METAEAGPSGSFLMSVSSVPVLANTDEPLSSSRLALRSRHLGRVKEGDRGIHPCSRSQSTPQVTRIPSLDDHGSGIVIPGGD